VKRVAVPTLVRSSGIKPKLLADNAEYVLGRGRADSEPERVRACHRAFVKLTARCAAETREGDVAAVHQFLCSDLAGLRLPDDFDPTATISFHVNGAAPVDLPAVREFWARTASEGQLMECLVCGRVRPAMERLQLKLKGIPGGQTSGLALISANADAFLSYGLQASYIAPTCQECSDRFMKAANRLIAGESTHLRLANTVYIFWTREDIPFSFATILSRPEPDQVRELLASVFKGGDARLDPTPFYAAALSASGARAVVRDWIDTTVGRARENLARFFTLQDITGPWGDQGRPRGIYTLGKATVRSGSNDDPAPWVFKALMRCALAGGPLPASLLFKAVERCRVERDVSHERAALIKMALATRYSTRHETGGKTMVELEADNRDPAYLCGRLFAELEAVQRAALGDVGAGIVDRYYGTASSAPATVFGRLVRGAQPHLGKLRRERPGAYRALDGRLQDILASLDAFPPTLTLEQQALFALGYYHQRAADRHAARARSDKRDDLAGVTEDNLTANSEEE
jgi:CRISPR-associated protein Csd1